MAGGVASMQSRAAARSASSSADGPSAPCRATEQQAVELVGEQLHDVRNLVRPPAACKRRPASIRARRTSPRPVPTQAADVVALAMSVASFGQQLVEQRSVLTWDAGTNGCDVGFGDVEILGGAEQRRQLQGGDLGQGGPVDVVAGDRAPHVLLKPGVDGGSGVGAECSHVVDRLERGHRHPAAPDRARRRAEHDGCFDRRRRAAGEQTCRLVGADPHRSQCASRSPVGTRSPPCVARFARRSLEVRQRSRRVPPARRRRGRRLHRLPRRFSANCADLSRSNHWSTSWRQRRWWTPARRSWRGAARGARAMSFMTNAGGGPWAWNPASRRRPAGACTGSRARTWPAR